MAAFSVVPTSNSSTLAVHNFVLQKSTSALRPQSASNHHHAAILASSKFRSTVYAIPIQVGERIQLQTSFIKGAGHQNLLLEKINASQARVRSGSKSGGALLTEANIFERTARIFRAFIGGVVSSNEDPERLLEQATEDMGNDLAKLRQTSAQVVASKRMLESKYNQAQTASSEWYRRAKKALEKGDEMLAKEALKRKKMYDDSAKVLGSQLAQQTSVVDRMLSSAQLLETKINEARSKKDTLKARAQSAKTSKYIQELVGSIDTSSALAAYERMEEKVVRLEAEAEALGDITEDNLETKFALLESEDVGDDLDALKREMGFSKPTRGELPWNVASERSRDKVAEPYDRY